MKECCRLRQLREARGISQEDLGKVIGVKRQTVFKYEAGIIENIPMDKVRLLAEYFHVSPAYLAGLSDYANEKSILELTAEDNGFREAATVLRKAREANAPAMDRVINSFYDLNKNGQQKLADYAEDLVASKRYGKGK